VLVLPDPATGLARPGLTARIGRGPCRCDGNHRRGSADRHSRLRRARIRGDVHRRSQSAGAAGPTRRAAAPRHSSAGGTALREAGAIGWRPGEATGWLDRPPAPTASQPDSRPAEEEDRAFHAAIRETSQEEPAEEIEDLCAARQPAQAARRHRTEEIEDVPAGRQTSPTARRQGTKTRRGCTQGRVRRHTSAGAASSAKRSEAPTTGSASYHTSNHGFARAATSRL